MNPEPFNSELLKDFAIIWSIQEEDKSVLLRHIDVKAKKTEKERDSFKLDMMQYKAKYKKCKAYTRTLEEENEELKQRLDRFENPN